MKKSIKYFGLAFALLALVGCSKNFCTSSDKANMLLDYALKNEETVKENIKNQGIACPSENFENYIEYKIYEYATKGNDVKELSFGDKKLEDYSVKELKEAKGYNYNIKDVEVSFDHSTYYANIKYTGLGDEEKNRETLWYNFDKWTLEAKDEVHKSGKMDVNVFGENNETQKITITENDLPTEAYLSSYKNAMNNAVNNITSCMTPVDGVYDGIFYEGKSWGEAFGVGGFSPIAGLLQYPISWMLHSFYSLFNIGAIGAILSILIVTIIVRLFLLAISFKSSIAQTKMQEIQPELNALQAKYPNSNSDEYQKRMLAQAQADLYKKHKINPFSTIIIMFIQFPIFISVWGAMSGTSILRVDTLFENGGPLFALKLSENMNNAMFTFNGGFNVNITAVILFLLMSAAQILSTKIPMWLSKRDQKKAPKLGKNPAQDQSGKQMNMVSNVMMIMIIFMGFTLPVGMAIYWFISAIISLAQSLIIRLIGKVRKPKSQYAKYKTKK